MPYLRSILVLVLGAAAGAASGQTWLDEGLAALGAGEREGAALQFAGAVAADPDDEQARVLLGLARAQGRRAERRALDRALRVAPDRPELYELRLGHLRDEVGEARVLSVADTRRVTTARRLVALDPRSASGHEELALHAFLDYQWRRRNAERRRLWNPSEPSYATRAALRARERAHAHLAAASEAESGRPGVHRLRMRIAAYERDPRALLDAAQSARRARPGDPWSALYHALALARLGRHPEADSACRLGVRGLPASERYAFESPARFVRPDDRPAFEADSVAWAERFWDRRDGRRLTGENERWVEHCARLIEADLLYRTEAARGWDTARGDTHVRYGAPRRESWWLAQRDGRFHRWVYPDFSVTFQDWVSNGDYQPASSAYEEDDATRLRSYNNTVGEQGGREGVQSLPVAASAFRSPTGAVEWVVAYRAESTGPRATLRAGVFQLDAQGEVVFDERQQDHDFVTHRGGWTGATTVPDLGSAVTVEADRPGSPTFGRGEVALARRDLHGTGLVLSDLLLAYRIDVADVEAAPPGHVRRGAYVVHPAPDEPYTVADPLFVYVEAYGLGVENGATRFEVEAVLQPVDHAGRLGRLSRTILGRRPPASVSVATEQQGDAAYDAVALTLDLQNQPPGDYRLTLTLRDLIANASASVSRDVRLDSP